ncbi:MAG: ABC transporter ATP-binding protein [Deltaproteobacteria bacterium]|nr:ABC transporter ATP-binding protein [Deltaproteobacteria bacterium]MBI3078508.1 ABC transporter ATP-binding protein [Deltaproteobacteria bacterium]
MLKVRGIRSYYGRVEALKGISLEVNEREIIALIGSNGAGKSTTLRTISGLITPADGAIEFLDRRIDGLPPKEIVRLGISHCPEERKIWPRLTVEEHLELGAFLRGDRSGVRADMEQMFTVFPVLRERRRQLGGTLSGGEQQMLAIGRALMSQPKLVMFDEPSLGLAPLVVELMARIIQGIHERGATVLLVEQNAFLALNLAHRAYVLETGRIVLEGPARALLENEHVKRAYLGSA